MATEEQKQQVKKAQEERDENFNALIGEQVSYALGKTNDRRRVQVRQLWGCYYRVNILVGDEVNTLKITESYFLKTDGKGNILESTPRMKEMAMESQKA